MDGCTYFSESHRHCQKELEWEGLSGHQLVFIGGILRLISGIVCVVRCSSQSEPWQPAWSSQLRPKEIPAICHPYKVTFSFIGKSFRTGSDTEDPVCASPSGLNLLTCLLTHQWAVIVPLTTHFTTPHIFSSMFIIGLNIIYMCWNEQWGDVSKSPCVLPHMCTLFYNYPFLTWQNQDYDDWRAEFLPSCGSLCSLVL